MNSCLKWRNDTLSCFQIHLFDIDVPGKIRFQESETLSPGNSLSMFETRKRRLFSLVSFLMLRRWTTSLWLTLFANPPTAFCKVGVGICYDIRFAELAQLYSRKGAGRMSLRLWFWRADQLMRLCVCLQVLSCWSTPEPSTWRPVRLTGSCCRGEGQTNTPRNKLKLTTLY